MARGYRLHPRRSRLILAGLGVVIIGAGLELTSLFSSNPIVLAQKYIESLNARDFAELQNSGALTKAPDTDWLPDDILAGIDTSLNNPILRVEGDPWSSTAQVFITSENRKEPIVLAVEGDIVWDGLLMTREWRISSPATVVTFVTADSLAADASVTIAGVGVGTRDGARISELTSKKYSSPAGLLAVNVGATTFAEGSENLFWIGSSRTLEVMLGSGAVVLENIIHEAAETANWNMLLPYMASSVDVLVANGFQEGITTQDPEGAVSILTNERVQPHAYNWYVDDFTRQEYSDWLARKFGTESFMPEDAIYGYAYEDQDGCQSYFDISFVVENDLIIKISEAPASSCE